MKPYTVYNVPFGNLNYASEDISRYFSLVNFQPCEAPDRTQSIKYMMDEIERRKRSRIASGQCLRTPSDNPVFVYASEDMPYANVTIDFLAEKWFTLGLLKVNEGTKDKIINIGLSSKSPIIIDLYKCKDSKKSRYEGFTNSCTAIINEQIIVEDFVVFPVTKFRSLEPGTIYFFYTKRKSCFQLKRGEKISRKVDSDPLSDERKFPEKRESSFDDSGPSGTTESGVSGDMSDDGSDETSDDSNIRYESLKKIYKEVIEKLQKELNSVKSENEELKRELERKSKFT